MELEELAERAQGLAEWLAPEHVAEFGADSGADPAPDWVDAYEV